MKFLLLFPLIFLFSVLPSASYFYECEAEGQAETEDPEGLLEPSPAPSAVRVMLEKIAFCESSGNPLAVNPKSNARGLFQIIESTEELVEKNTGREINTLNADDSWFAAEWLVNYYGDFRSWNASRECWLKS